MQLTKLQHLELCSVGLYTLKPDELQYRAAITATRNLTCLKLAQLKGEVLPRQALQRMLPAGDI